MKAKKASVSSPFQLHLLGASKPCGRCGTLKIQFSMRLSNIFKPGYLLDKKTAAVELLQLWGKVNSFSRSTFYRYGGPCYIPKGHTKKRSPRGVANNELGSWLLKIYHSLICSPGGDLEMQDISM